MSDIDNIVKILDNKLEKLNKNLIDLRSKISPIEDEYNKILDSKNVLLGNHLTFSPKERSHRTKYNTSKEVLEYVKNNPGLIGSDIINGLGDKSRSASIYSTLITLYEAGKLDRDISKHYFPTTIDNNVLSN